jgi:hypothetical protein
MSCIRNGLFSVVLLTIVVPATATPPILYKAGFEATASTSSGGKYDPAKAVDQWPGTWWASSDKAPAPQWLELRLPEAVTVDSLIIETPAHTLYSPWAEAQIHTGSGDPVMFTFEEGQFTTVVRFPSCKTDRIRITALSVVEARHYIGVADVTLALDPDEVLRATPPPPSPMARDEIVVRGRTDHPCVNVTRADVEQARARTEQHEWARGMKDAILKEADRWLEHDDAYWLAFLPEPGACYAYGFTGCPITGERLGGTWAGARCAWDHPGQVRNAEGRWLPDAEHPDDGKGYVAKDGRIHYLVGIFNSWVTEQWTIHALPALSRAYQLTGDERYAERGILLLDALASIYAESTSGSWDYPSDPPSGRFARPWYQVARTLVKYVDHYDFMYHSPAMERPSLRPGMTCRQNIEQYMMLDGAYYCYAHSFHGALHNGHADYMRGALAVGCLLDVPEYVRHAVASPFSIHTMLANNIDRDGRYYETALGYAVHARLLYLTFADPLLNMRNAEYPHGINLYDDPKMQASLLLPDIQVEVAGRRPNFGDAGPDHTYKPFPKSPTSTTDYLFLERLYAMTSDPEKQGQYGAALQLLAEGDVERLRRAQKSDWLLWHAAPPPETSPALPPELEPRVAGSWVAGMKGMAILRSGEQAALVRFGPSLNHGDPDDLALLYYANGYELSYDIGYGLGSTHCQVGWGSSTVSHCLVTIDETNQFAKAGSGGSLHFLGGLPGVQVVEASSESSYTASGVTEYRRTVALVGDPGYMLDVFRVTGGRQHDYGFGSIGTDLQPFGVNGLAAQEGSLAEGVAWGEKIGKDGDIEGYPNKPYWNPPPKNGYGFFYDVRRGTPEPVWGGTWSIAGTVPTQMRMHVAGDAAEAIIASAPGLYPSKPLASYVLARRKSEDDAPLTSTFIAVYEPFATAGMHFDYDHGALAGNLVESTAETKTIPGISVFLLKGAKNGDSMTFKVRTDADTPAQLVTHFVNAPSYGTAEVLWDGSPVGEPVSLYDAQIAGPVPAPLGNVDTSPGEHTLTFRAADAGSFFIGVSGISFGEPAASTGGPEPVLKAVERLGEAAIAVTRLDGITDVLLSGPCTVASPYGPVEFDGDFALLRGETTALREAQVLGCGRLVVNGEIIDNGPAAFEAVITDIVLEQRAVVLDKALPEGLAGRVAVFSNPAYSRTTAYHVLGASGNTLALQASSFSLGIGRVNALISPTELTSDIPHEYARGVRGSGSTGFFDGKRIVGEHGGSTRVLATAPGSPMRLSVENAAALAPDETFEYLDLSPGDHVRIALTRAHEL